MKNESKKNSCKMSIKKHENVKHKNNEKAQN